MLVAVIIVAGFLAVCVAIMLVALWFATDEPPATLESGQASHRRPPR